MQSKTNRAIRVAAIMVAALGVTALQASAQKGTFNLPVEAHWGKVVLAPGVHQVQVPFPTNGQRVAYVYTENRAQMSVPLTTQIAQDDRSYLHLVRVNGTYYVDAYQSHVNGLKYFFPRPKPANTEDAAAAEEKATLIAVDWQ